MKGQQIQGEYKRVSCLSKVPRLLQEAHLTTIDAEDAIILAERLKRIFPVVAFNVNISGKDKRGQANAWTGKFNLPASRLRVGIVLHEFAHILKDSQGIRGSAHGPAFTRCLDEIVKVWFLKIRDMN